MEVEPGTRLQGGVISLERTPKCVQALTTVNGNSICCDVGDFVETHIYKLCDTSIARTTGTSLRLTPITNLSRAYGSRRECRRPSS